MRFASAVALLAIIAPAVVAQTATPGPEIVTSGSGSVTLPADRATVRVGIATRSANASQASSANGPIVIRVQDTLRVLGLFDRNARVMSFGVAPVYDYSNDNNRVTGYEARTTLEVAVRDVAALGRVLDAALAVGATEINSITFSSDTAAAGKRNALRIAMSTARNEAMALADANGGRLGALKSITTTPDQFGRTLQEMAMRGAPMELRGAVPAVLRDVVVYASVSARWVFVPTP